LCVAAKTLNLPVILHHHSFRYIDRHSLLMATVVRLSRASVTHVFLCDCMEERFCRAYSASIKTRVLSNVGLLPDTGTSAFDVTRPLTVGFLSNLSAEKGLFRFLDVARRTHESGLDVRFVLAGPAGGTDEADAIAQCANLTRLDYRGGVYGEEKARFYRDIDVFLFPSLYRNEAQPLVLFEAMLAGCSVIAIDRGCVAEQVGDKGLVMTGEEDFAMRAVEHLRVLAADRTALNSRRRAIALATRALAEKSREEALALAREI
jgi:glycosyltransferase involved in cell wall biosynthesis